MPISSLPIELLQIIFRIVRDDLLAGDDEDMSWMSLTRVSRHWRDVLHGDPFLWTRLAFTDQAPFYVVEAAIHRSHQVGGVDLKLVASSLEPSSVCGWIERLSIGWPGTETYELPGTVRFLSFRWREGVRDMVFNAIEALRADGVVSLVLEEHEDPEDIHGDNGGSLSELPSDGGSVVSGDDTKSESESKSESETESADDEDDSDSGDGEGASDDDTDSGTDTDSKDTDSGLDGHWDGPELDDASSEDESSGVSIPDSTFGGDSSTYLDSESDRGKHVSEPEDEELGGEATGTESGDDYDGNLEATGEFEETDSHASDPAEDENVGNAVFQPRFLGPHRLLLLPEFPSLINLAISSVLLSIPLQVKGQLTDMTLMNTSWYEEYEDAEFTQSWLLDVLEGCVQLGRLRLFNTLLITSSDPGERTVALPNLKLLRVEDILGGVQNIVPFLPATFSEGLTHIDLRSLLCFEQWVPAVDGVFVGNLPEDFVGPYFADTVALNLQADDEFVLRGRMQTPLRWDLRAIYDPDDWSEHATGCLLGQAVLDLFDPCIVTATSITTLAIHIAPKYRTSEVNWASLISGLPHVSKFELGGDMAVATFLEATRPERPVSYWPSLTEFHFCLAILRWDLQLSLQSLCRQLWPRDTGSEGPILDMKVYLRLPGVQTGAPSDPERAPPCWFAAPWMYAAVENLSGEYDGRVQIVGHRCKVCHQPDAWVKEAYGSETTAMTRAQ